MRIGIHTSTRDRIDRAANRAREMGCEVIQIFSCNPRSWSMAKLDEAAADEFIGKLDAFDIRPLIVHVTYLPNLATSDRTVRRKSIRRVIDEVRRSDRLGADYFVTHLGYHMGAGVERGLANLRDAIRAVLDATTPNLTLLLENTAGHAGSVGGRFEHIGWLIGELAGAADVGVCFDTAHAFAAGYDLRTPEAVAATCAEFDRLVGLTRIRMIHANDAMLELGSHRDRHENIGGGHIGRKGFRAMLEHPALTEVPFILETPYEDEAAATLSIRRLKRLRTSVYKARKEV